MFYHDIILEKIEDCDKNIKNEIDSIVLLEGKNGCPPEDGEGNGKYSETLLALESGQGKKFHAALEDCVRAMNYGHTGNSFKGPYTYDLEKHRKELYKALRTEQSPMDDRNFRIDPEVFFSAFGKK